MPPELETKSEQQTVALIEKGIQDIKDNMATKKEVLGLIDERIKIDKEANKVEAEKAKVDFAQLKTEADEIKAAAIELQSQVRHIKANRYTSLKNADGSYHGMFPNPMEAKAFGLFIMAAATANKSALKSKYEFAVKALDQMGEHPLWLDEKGLKVMTGGSQSGGSALVTVEMIPTLLSLFEQYGVFEGESQAVPMGAGSTLQPKTDSLLTLYCPGEGGEITTTDPSIKLISHNLKTLCALTAYSMELDEDSAIALGEMIAFLLVRSYGYGIDQIGFLGDGTSTYFGMKGIVGALMGVSATIASIKSLIVGTGNAYSELILNDFLKVPGILPDYADDAFAKWYMHRYFYYTILVALALASGGANATEIILGAGQRQKQFLSYPVRFTQVMPKAEANSQIPALLANLKLGAQLGRRGILEIAESSERYFEKGLIAVRARRRLSINVHGVGDTTNAGPICGLITAAS